MRHGHHLEIVSKGQSRVLNVRQSLLLGASTVFCVAVVACTVVIKPSMMVYLSWMTLARGAKQLVVQEALEMILCSELYESRLTPQTYIGASADGAEMMTFFAPPLRCALALCSGVRYAEDAAGGRRTCRWS